MPELCGCHAIRLDDEEHVVAGRNFVVAGDADGQRLHDFVAGHLLRVRETELDVPLVVVEVVGDGRGTQLQEAIDHRPFGETNRKGATSSNPSPFLIAPTRNEHPPAVASTELLPPSR